MSVQSYSDGMLDLETLGTRPGCAVVEIGVVLFDPWSGRTGACFHSQISYESNMRAGLISERSAVDFHMENGTLNEILCYRTPLSTGLMDLNLFLAHHQPEMLWAKGGDFDWPILRAACDAAGVSFFYSKENGNRHRQLSCMRGVVDLAERLGGLSEPAAAHSALPDAVAQVETLCRALEILGRDGS